MEGGSDVALSPKTRTALRLVAILAALGILIWLLDRIGWQTIGDAFLRVGPGGAVILLIMGFFEAGFDSAALGAATGRRVPLWRCMTYNGAGAVINNVIPWDAGEVLKGSLLTRHMSGKDAISSTVLWNYLFKLSRPSALLFAAAAGWVLGHEVSTGIALMILGLCFVGFAPYLIVRFLIRYGLAHTVVRVLQKLRILRADPEKLLASARELDAQMQAFWREHPGDFLRVVIYQFMGRITAWVTYFVCMRMIGMELAFGSAAMIYVGLMVANWLVVLMPARVGVSESAGYLVFSALGFDGGLGLIVTIIMRIKALTNNGFLAVLAALSPKPKEKSP